MLATSDRGQWIRLVGPQALPPQAAIRLRPAINAAWRSMFETLLSSGQLEKRADGAWIRGQHFSSAGLQASSAKAQRAAFAIRVIRSIDVGKLTAAVAPEDNVVWLGSEVSDQADLFTAAIHPPVAPSGRAGPRLWIRPLAIFKDPQTIIRDVSLKPALNIVWTPDMSSSGSRALAHGSGKTTFCRLLRTCLGEPSYATDTQRSRLMARLPNGLIAAEILIDGVCWAAVRPLGLPGGEFVAQVDSIEDALGRGHRENDPSSMDAVIIAIFFSTIVGATPPDVGHEQVWDVLRAWLTRDQECRLADILAWRSSQTQSRTRAQVIGETSNLTMVRLALRALDAEERTAASRERELVAAVEDERRSQAYQQQRYTDGLKAVRLALRADDEVDFDDTIDRKGLVSLAEAALANAMRTDLPKPPDVGSIFARQKRSMRRTGR